MARLFDMIDMKEMGKFQNIFPGTALAKRETVFRREGVLAQNDAAEITRMEKTGRLRALRMAKEAEENAGSAIAKKRTGSRIKRAG